MGKISDSSAHSIIEQYRKEVLEKYRLEIQSSLEEMSSKNLFPFEGKWRNLEEIEMLQKLMKKKDRTIFVDLIILVTIILIFDLFLIAIIFSL